MMKILVPTLGALVLTTATTAHEAAPAVAAFPCELVTTTPPPSPTPTPPGAPQNLRIISGGGIPDDFELEGDSPSGPYVEEADFVASPTAAANPHAYYEMLAQRSDCIRAYSLRDPAQLEVRDNGGYSVQNDKPPAVFYIYPNDPDPRRQDAAKVVIPTSTNNLPNQVRLPIPMHAPQSLFVTWEGWFGREWIGAGIPDQKTWQIGSPFNDIHMEVRNRYGQAQNQSPGSIALIDGRLYPEGGYSVGPNITSYSTLAPMAGQFFVQPETWTRWFAHFKAPAAGSVWYEYSLWAADVNQDPVLIYDRLQVRPSPQSTTASWEAFWLEFNTSTSTVKAGRPDLVAYVRNVAILKGLTDPRPLLQRPIP